MQGVTILDTIDNLSLRPGFTPWIILAVIIVILGALIIHFVESYTLAKIGEFMLIAGLFFFVFCIFTGGSYHYKTYQVLVEDNVSFNDFEDRYEIIYQKGSTFFVRDKNVISEE
jgi:hypothetical protein